MSSRPRGSTSTRRAPFRISLLSASSRRGRARDRRSARSQSRAPLRFACGRKKPETPASQSPPNEGRRAARGSDLHRGKRCGGGKKNAISLCLCCRRSARVHRRSQTATEGRGRKRSRATAQKAGRDLRCTCPARRARPRPPPAPRTRREGGSSPGEAAARRDRRRPWLRVRQLDDLDGASLPDVPVSRLRLPRRLDRIGPRGRQACRRRGPGQLRSRKRRGDAARAVRPDLLLSIACTIWETRSVCWPTCAGASSPTEP